MFVEIISVSKNHAKHKYNVWATNEVLKHAVHIVMALFSTINYVHIDLQNFMEVEK
jgi:hypothetical protein